MIQITQLKLPYGHSEAELENKIRKTLKLSQNLKITYKITKKYTSDKIGTEHLLLAILEEKECVAAKILTKKSWQW